MIEISFKSLSFEDLPILHNWLTLPHVKAFWDKDIEWTEEMIVEKYGSYVDGYKLVDRVRLPLHAFIIFIKNAPIGYIQFYDAFLFPRDNYNLKEALADTTFKNAHLAAIDLFIGDEKAIGKGIGPAAMRQFLTEYVYNNFDGCLVDPDQVNKSAIRAYEKAGFSKIKNTPDDQAVIMVAISTGKRPESRPGSLEQLPLLNTEGQMIKSENFQKKSFENHTFISCSFYNCNFSQALLRNAKFCSCNFFSCNLSLVKLDGCRIQDTKFTDCKIVGAEFFKCEKRFFSPAFKNSLLQYCNFSDLDMKNASFDGSKLKENHFTNTCLNAANFKDVDLSGSIFHNCDLCKADFSTATHYDIDPHTNKIKKAKFSLPEAVGLLRGFDIIIN